MLVPHSCRPRRVKGFLNLKVGLALGASALLSLLAVRYEFDSPPDMTDWQMSDFLAHLQKSGLQLHVVPAAQHGLLCDGVYLTEDRDATWADMQSKPRLVERIDCWRGTVRIGLAHPWMDVPVELALSGENGRRIGGFVLFGDERLLRRIEQVCGQRRGR